MLYLHLELFFQSLVLIRYYFLEVYQDMCSLSVFQNYMYQDFHIHFYCKAFMILS